MDIFLVEAEKDINNALKIYFELRNYRVSQFYDIKEANKSISIEYDVYLIDLKTSVSEALNFIKDVRELNKKSPIIIISTPKEIKKLKDAYDLGCSDHIKRPFEAKELEERIKRFCGRNTPLVKLSSELNYYLDTKILTHNDKPIKLSKHEKKLLEILIKNRGIVVSADMIFDNIWGRDKSFDSGLVRSIVCRLRKKMISDLIFTSVDLGYGLK